MINLKSYIFLAQKKSTRERTFSVIAENTPCDFKSEKKKGGGGGGTERELRTQTEAAKMKADPILRNNLKCKWIYLLI